MSCHLEIYYNLKKVSTDTLIKEILERSEKEDIEVLDNLAYQYLRKNLKPEILKAKLAENNKATQM
ncbi:MAG: hypothetical protein ACTTJX_01745 [Fusobacterium sp.]|jgi:hypothetical protein|uniref:hypothetical protein n=1 Tax=Fusobacterium sp. TaxID=68766 RepID=UPI003FA165B2